jgi:DedD protein
VVQLGAYKDDKNVRQLQAKLKELKLPVYTEKIESAQGARTRVRAGPFASRDAAEKAQARIEKVGVGGTVAAK